ncbi:hypothetical protein [Paramagnetospirillum marisnigri]|nr:hypothetical protein [Paramagnetospirillum marisnigri]
MARFARIAMVLLVTMGLAACGNCSAAGSNSGSYGRCGIGMGF